MGLVSRWCKLIDACFCVRSDRFYFRLSFVEMLELLVLQERAIVDLASFDVHGENSLIGNSSNIKFQSDYHHVTITNATLGS